MVSGSVPPCKDDKQHKKGMNALKYKQLTAGHFPIYGKKILLLFWDGGPAGLCIIIAFLYYNNMLLFLLYHYICAQIFYQE